MLLLDFVYAANDKNNNAESMPCKVGVFIGAVANQLKSGNFLRQKKIFIKEAITV